jgi:hypothetical protein
MKLLICSKKILIGQNNTKFKFRSVVNRYHASFGTKRHWVQFPALRHLPKITGYVYNKLMADSIRDLERTPTSPLPALHVNTDAANFSAKLLGDVSAIEYKPPAPTASPPLTPRQQADTSMDRQDPSLDTDLALTRTAAEMELTDQQPTPRSLGRRFQILSRPTSSQPEGNTPAPLDDVSLSTKHIELRIGARKKPTAQQHADAAGRTGGGVKLITTAEESPEAAAARALAASERIRRGQEIAVNATVGKVLLGVPPSEESTKVTTLAENPQAPAERPIASDDHLEKVQEQLRNGLADTNAKVIQAITQAPVISTPEQDTDEHARIVAEQAAKFKRIDQQLMQPAMAEVNDKFSQVEQQAAAEAQALASIPAPEIPTSQPTSTQSPTLRGFFADRLSNLLSLRTS